MDNAYLAVEHLTEMQNKIIVTVNDYNRLTGLTGFASLNLKMPEVVNRLFEKLSVARMLPQESIDKRIVTMNSRVRLRDLDSGRETEVTITYPHEADTRERRISVFSEIGVALLGAREKDVVSWKIPAGTGRFEVVKVTYQPEAAGHFYL